MHLGFLTIYWRDMIRFYRFKTLLISSLVQPALWMAFFGIAMSANFNRLTSEIPPIPGVPSVDYLTFMAAGVIAMTTLFASLFGGMSLLFDKNWGLMRGIFASPLPRNHIIFGIALSGMTKSFIQSIIIMVSAILIGAPFFFGYSATNTLLATERYDFNVTRCGYADMYRSLGVPELGALLSCNRDYALIEGFNREVTLTRTQTIMEGAPHCDFRFRLKRPSS